MSTPSEQTIAGKLKLNLASPTTGQWITNRHVTVSTFVRRFRRGSILRELPVDILNVTIETIE
jgi:hypothetical protein